jgi:NAD dependent epimerase/dehydratase family enzyme
MVFGPDSPGNLERMISMLRRGVFLRLSGGKQQKSLLPIEMLIATIRHLANQSHATCGDVWNVAAEPPLTIDEIGSVIAEALEVKPFRLSVPAGAARFIARALDVVLSPLTGSALAPTADTYSQSAIISTDKLRRAMAVPSMDVREALLRAVRGRSVRAR